MCYIITYLGKSLLHIIHDENITTMMMVLVMNLLVMIPYCKRLQGQLGYDIVVLDLLVYTLK